MALKNNTPGSENSDHHKPSSRGAIQPDQHYTPQKAQKRPGLLNRAFETSTPEQQKVQLERERRQREVQRKMLLSQNSGGQSRKKTPLQTWRQDQQRKFSPRDAPGDSYEVHAQD
jgi:hypothetical protein